MRMGIRRVQRFVKPLHLLANAQAKAHISAPAVGRCRSYTAIARCKSAFDKSKITAVAPKISGFYRALVPGGTMGCGIGKAIDIAAGVRCPAAFVPIKIVPSVVVVHLADKVGAVGKLPSLRLITE